MFTNKPSISCAYISKSKRCFDVKYSTCYFHMKIKILTDFQICISLPLNTDCSLLNTADLYISTNISSFKYTDDDRCKIIWALNINKAYGHDNISVRIIKICDELINKPLYPFSIKTVLRLYS